MRRTVSLVTVMAAAAVLSACGGTDVVVQAQVKGLSATDTAAAEAAPTPLTGVEVRLLPYDRDALFDSLTKVADTPEPEIPDSLMQLQEKIAQANLEYQQATQTWNEARDSLKTLSDQMNKLSRASAEYKLMFRDFNELDDKVSALEKEMNQSFKAFTDLQKRFADQAQQIKLQRNQWADEAFRSVDSIIRVKLAETEREELADTTDGNGVAEFGGVKEGKWWATARYELPYEELYWNVPVEAKGDQVQMTLDRQNAQSRPKL